MILQNKVNETPQANRQSMYLNYMLYISFYNDDNGNNLKIILLLLFLYLQVV